MRMRSPGSIHDWVFLSWKFAPNFSREFLGPASRIFENRPQIVCNGLGSISNATYDEQVQEAGRLHP